MINLKQPGAMDRQSGRDQRRQHAVDSRRALRQTEFARHRRLAAELDADVYMAPADVDMAPADVDMAPADGEDVRAEGGAADAQDAIVGFLAASPPPSPDPGQMMVVVRQSHQPVGRAWSPSSLPDVDQG